MTQLANYPSLSDRSVLISGGGSGIGAGLVEHFARQGARVAFLDVAEEPSHALCEALAPRAAHRPLFLKCDVTDIAALRISIEQAAKAHGPIDVLINNAAHDERHRLEDLTPELWQMLMDVNLRHHVFAIQAVAPAMQARKSGSIVNFSSLTWLKGIAGLPVYATAKAGIAGLTRVMARELGEDGIRVNTILPGWIMTERQVTKWLTPEAEARLMQNQSLKEKLYPADIAAMALFLAADDSRLITGQQFVVDGGTG